MSQGDRFRRKALRRGYKVDEVDDFLDRAEATLAGEPIGQPLTPDDIRDVVFRTRFGGYDEWQVDLHLDRLERELEDLATGAPPRQSNGFPIRDDVFPGRDDDSATAQIPRVTDRRPRPRCRRRCRRCRRCQRVRLRRPRRTPTPSPTRCRRPCRSGTTRTRGGTARPT
jgi:DivIVA domain-containing protein